MIIKLDGPYIPKSGWTGPIGKLMEKVCELETNCNFTPFKDTASLVHLPDDIIDGLSTDQKTAYKHIQAVKSGILSKEVANLKTGELSTARWLTSGDALVTIWTSCHNLEGETLRKLEVLVRFCLEVYFILYFEIKVKHHISNGPAHILRTLELLRNQTEEVKNIITSVVHRGAYHAHPEKIMPSMLTSDDAGERSFAVEKILQVRNGSEEGDTSVRKHKTPKLNLGATSVRELINWEGEKVFEPVFTTKLDIDEIKELVNTPLQIQTFSLHTQSCERVVQEVSKASTEVCGDSRRDGWVRARVAHREVMPVFASKKDILAAKSLWE